MANGDASWDGIAQAMIEAKSTTRTARLRFSLALAASALLAACAVVPDQGRNQPSNQPAPPPPSLPTDVGRNRVALLVPMTGINAAAGQALANATTMALLDTNATSIRITTYDTGNGAAAAASRALADGNRLILGPVQADEAQQVGAMAHNARVPVISFSNDAGVAGNNVFVMGTVPTQSVARVVRYAKSKGITRFAALVPVGSYGARVSNAMMMATKASGTMLVGMESYDQSRNGLSNAVRRLKARGSYQAVLVGDTARVAALAAPLLKANAPAVRILGTELWGTDAASTQTPALYGAWYAALSDQRYPRFADSYRQRFGDTPYRLSTLGYDSVLLALRIAREWQPGTVFPTQRLYDRGGFLGLDGIFRFNDTDVIERSLEVREARWGTASVVSPAPARFED
jgi:branched-chain amino acid transport system substrate-binding protein